MKKLNILILTLLMSLNSLAFAQDANDGPPDSINDLLENIFDQEAPAQPDAQPNNQQQQQQAAPNTQQTGQSNSFDLGGLNNFNQGSGQQQQVSPVIFAPASQQIQPITPAPSTMLQGNLLPALQPMAQTYQAPPQVAQTGPGALAALIPVAGYSLFAFRRRD